MMKKLLFGICLVVSVAALVGCSDYFTKQAGKPAIDQMKAALDEGIKQDKQIQTKSLQAVPSNVNTALMPSLAVSGPKMAQARFDVSVNDMPARVFFLGLVKDTNMNMMVDPDVSGRISLDLKEVTIAEVLSAVHHIYHFEIRKLPYGYQISQPKLETHTFNVNYLDVVRSGKSGTLISAGQQISQMPSSGSTSNTSSNARDALLGGTGSSSKTVQPASSVDTESKTHFWESLQNTLALLVGKDDGQQVVINPDAGIVIVRAYPSQIQEVGRYLDNLQQNMGREVIIDAKILEVRLYDGYQSGIDWKAIGLNINGQGALGAVGNKSLSSMFGDFDTLFKVTGSADHGDFTALVTLLSTQGNVQVLSSPRIATMNNQKAVIKVGQDEYFVTNVSSTLFGTGIDTEASQDLELTPFFSGIALDVTPQISGDGNVILHIHPIVSKVTDQKKTITINDKEQDLPLALSEVRESDSIVHAKNNQIIVIGGLMEDITEEAQGMPPVLGKIPGIGPLLRRTNQQSTKVELVILLQPRIVGSNTWSEQLHDSRQAIHDLDRGFMFGSHPKVFGNEGEPGFGNKNQ